MVCEKSRETRKKKNHWTAGAGWVIRKRNGINYSWELEDFCKITAAGRGNGNMARPD